MRATPQSPDHPPAAPEDRRLQILPASQWIEAERLHRERVAALTAGRRERAARSETHPVEDFLWVYYRWRPGHIARWHPGLGRALAPDVTGATSPHEAGDALDQRAGWRHHRRLTSGGVTLDVAAYLADRGETVRRWHDILAATSSRPAHFGCFGLHEWAMVHGLPGDDPGHGGVGLRLGAVGTDAVTESHRIRCTHYDAFRFFTASAEPLNTLRPGPQDRAAFEQPGCVHATMDLYKVAASLGPLVPGHLLTQALELARDARELDMRASPYDLRDWGYEPIAVETAGGKAEYVRGQRGLAERAEPLRSALQAVTGQALDGGWGRPE